MTSPRTRMTVDVRREQLLDAGIALFARRSWEEVSIDEIAAACGVSRGLLYHYFRGKRDYYVATVAHAFERLHSLQPDHTLAPTEQLRVGLERFFESLEQDPDAHAALRRVAPADEEVARIVERNRQAFAERVLAGMPGAGGGSALARATARAWLGAVDAAGLVWLEARDTSPQDLIEILAEALAAAMLAAARIDPSIEIPPHVAAIGRSGIVKQIAEAETTDVPVAPPDRPQERNPFSPPRNTSAD